MQLGTLGILSDQEDLVFDLELGLMSSEDPKGLVQAGQRGDLLFSAEYLSWSLYRPQVIAGAPPDISLGGDKARNIFLLSWPTSWEKWPTSSAELSHWGLQAKPSFYTQSWGAESPSPLSRVHSPQWQLRDEIPGLQAHHPTLPCVLLSLPPLCTFACQDPL